MKENLIPLSNKQAVLQVLGCLIKDPNKFMNPAFRLSVDDFPEQFHKIVFGAIENLAEKKAEKINPIDIDQFLAPYTVQYKVFTNNNGYNYVAQAANAAEENNFNYYYQELKKYSILNRLRGEGFETDEILDPSLTEPQKIQRQQKVFDELTVTDILAKYRGTLSDIEKDYGTAEGAVEAMGGDDIFELLDSLEEDEGMGYPMLSGKMNTMLRGQRLKKLYIESAPQGMGKSRRAVGEFCNLAVKWFYNTKTNEWVDTGFEYPVLYLSTELELKEVQTMELAYVSGVNEDHIVSNSFGLGEKERVRQAAQYIKDAPIYFVSINNASIDDIENYIRRYHETYEVNFVYYDYLSSSMRILQEGASKTRISNLREDQILLMFTDRLKALCNMLNIHIKTATQLSGDWKNSQDPGTELLRGAKSIADKPDAGLILLPVREIDKPIIESYMNNKGFVEQPTHVLYFYKTRGTPYRGYRLYIKFDMGTCRLEDCFVTNAQGEFVQIDTVEIRAKAIEEQKEKAIPKPVAKPIDLKEKITEPMPLQKEEIIEDNINEVFENSQEDEVKKEADAMKSKIKKGFVF